MNNPQNYTNPAALLDSHAMRPVVDPYIRTVIRDIILKYVDVLSTRNVITERIFKIAGLWYKDIAGYGITDIMDMLTKSVQYNPHSDKPFSIDEDVILPLIQKKVEQHIGEMNKVLSGLQKNPDYIPESYSQTEKSLAFIMNQQQFYLGGFGSPMPAFTPYDTGMPLPADQVTTNTAVQEDAPVQSVESSNDLTLDIQHLDTPKAEMETSNAVLIEKGIAGYTSPTDDPKLNEFDRTKKNVAVFGDAADNAYFYIASYLELIKQDTNIFMAIHCRRPFNDIQDCFSVISKFLIHPYLSSYPIGLSLDVSYDTMRIVDVPYAEAERVVRKTGELMKVESSDIDESLIRSVFSFLRTQNYDVVKAFEKVIVDEINHRLSVTLFHPDLNPNGNILRINSVDDVFELYNLPGYGKLCSTRQYKQHIDAIIGRTLMSIFQPFYDLKTCVYGEIDFIRDKIKNTPDIQDIVPNRVLSPEHDAGDLMHCRNLQFSSRPNMLDYYTDRDLWKLANTEKKEVYNNFIKDLSAKAVLCIRRNAMISNLMTRPWVADVTSRRITTIRRPTSALESVLYTRMGMRGNAHELFLISRVNSHEIIADNLRAGIAADGKLVINYGN